MSATGRGVRGGGGTDFFATPAWCVRRLLDEIGDDLAGDRWLEPAVGGGAIVRAVDEWRAAERLPQAHWTGVDVRRVGYARETYDYTSAPYTQHSAAPRFDVAITNPPYMHALRFIEHAIVDAADVLMLLRLNFLEGDERAEFLREEGPDVFVLPNRPSFTGKGTDATSYGWFRFGERSRGRMKVLGRTPLAERRAARAALEAAE